LPIKRPRPRTKQLVEKHAFVVEHDKVLLEKSPARWRGMWILPPVKPDGLKPSSLPRPIYTSVFPFTNHRVTLKVFRQQLRKIDNGKCWFPFRKLDSIPIPSPHRRAIDALLGLNVSSVHAQR
jgi:hypothetical protein